jgi:hypothetical protein
MKYAVYFYYKGTSKESRYPVYTDSMVGALAACMMASRYSETEIVRL